MPRTKTTKRPKADGQGTDAFELRNGKKAREADSEVHVFGRGVICDTDTRGHATPQGRSLFEIVVDASEGFIPLWARGVTLRWRFQERSLLPFKKPASVKAHVRKLLGEALMSWGSAAPVRFAERNDAWDFEIVVRETDRCSVNGCVLASAFFPDAGRHELRVYPKMFEQDRQEQVETMIHEIGHVFGLRHFFANISETAWPSQVFGKHRRFTIMNYGADSKLTNDDRNDLGRMYRSAWKGELTQINETPIRLVQPFHATGAPPESLVAVGQIETVIQPPRGEYMSTV